MSKSRRDIYTLNGIIQNKGPRQNIFNWNHISDELTEEQIEELKSYYKTYHKKCWANKQAAKRFKKWKLLGNSLSIVFASGGISSSIATGGISLVAISTAALLIQGWMKAKDLDLNFQNCTYAAKIYQNFINDIIYMLRIGNFDSHNINNRMKIIDSYVTHYSPVVDKYLIKYDEKFTY